VCLGPQSTCSLNCLRHGLRHLFPVDALDAYSSPTVRGVRLTQYSLVAGGTQGLSDVVSFTVEIDDEVQGLIEVTQDLEPGDAIKLTTCWG